MNKRTLIRFVVYLVVLSFHQTLTYAQKALLKVGDLAPSITSYAWAKGEPINEFRKGTPYVLEFGATWCKPCAEAIPALTELQKKYAGRVEIIGFFVMEVNTDPPGTEQPKYIDRVKSYVEKQGDKLSYTVGIDDPEKTMEQNWIKSTGSTGVPQTFVVDKNGYIAMIASGFSHKKVDQLLISMENGTYNLSELKNLDQEIHPKEISYDRNKLLYLDGNGGELKSFLFRSLLTKYEGDLRAGSSEYVSSFSWLTEDFEGFKGTVQEVGISLLNLYYMAYSDTLSRRAMSRGFNLKFPDTVANPHLKNSYGKYWHKPVLEVSDRKPFEVSGTSAENRWNYSLKVPKERNTARFLQATMQRDLETYFGYAVNVEKRNMPCWFIKAHPGTAEKLKTKTPGGKARLVKIEDSSPIVSRVYNKAIADIVSYLSQYGTGQIREFEVFEGPFIDTTGINGEIDYGYTKEEIKSLQNKDFIGVQKWLERLGLYLEKGEKRMNVVVIRDPKSYW